MEIPGAWEFVLLALAAYRLTRLVGWDDWPPVARARAWVTGERWGNDLSIPAWLQNGDDDEEVEPGYDRPLLAHLIHCPFCIGFWISLAVWGFWQATPFWALVLLTPWALSGAVGLVAKNLDP